jgi:hypothetical protein
MTQNEWSGFEIRACLREDAYPVVFDKVYKVSTITIDLLLLLLLLL